MAESKVKRENYISLHGWMLTDLGLKGNELIIYACIYGFSQAESQVFSGSLQYLADWTNSTKQGVMKCLKSLVEKGYIVKTDKTINGVKFCEYHATELNRVLNKVAQGMQQSLTGGIKQSLSNNLVQDIQEEKKGKKKVSKKEDEEEPQKSFDELIAEYTENAELRKALGEYIKMRKMIKKTPTNYGLEQAFKKLNKLAKTDEGKIEIVNQSVMNSWQGLFPLKDSQPQSSYEADRKRALDENKKQWANLPGMKVI